MIYGVQVVRSCSSVLRAGAAAPQFMNVSFVGSEAWRESRPAPAAASAYRRSCRSVELATPDRRECQQGFYGRTTRCRPFTTLRDSSRAGAARRCAALAQFDGERCSSRPVGERRRRRLSGSRSRRRSHGSRFVELTVDRQGRRVPALIARLRRVAWRGGRRRSSPPRRSRSPTRWRAISCARRMHTPDGFVPAHALPALLPGAATLAFAYSDAKMLVGGADDAPAIPTLAELAAAGVDGARHYLGELRGRALRRDRRCRTTPPRRRASLRRLARAVLPHARGAAGARRARVPGRRMGPHASLLRPLRHADARQARRAREGMPGVRATSPTRASRRR